MKCKNGHKPPKGYRELKGDELELFFRAEESKPMRERQFSRSFRKRLPGDPDYSGTCIHFYTKK